MRPIDECLKSDEVQRLRRCVRNVDIYKRTFSLEIRWSFDGRILRDLQYNLAIIPVQDRSKICFVPVDGTTSECRL